MDSFSHPFRFTFGAAPVVDEDSDAFAAQIIAAAVKTAIGELPITTDFGSLPAEFFRLDTAGVVYSLSKYHPRIVINAIGESLEESKAQILIEFTRQAA